MIIRTILFAPKRRGKHLFLRYPDNHITKVRIVFYQGPVRIQKPPTPFGYEFTKDGLSVSADTSSGLGQGPGINRNSHLTTPMLIMGYFWKW